MPQKRTTGRTSGKATRKTSSKRTTSRRTSKKPKVYIPAYKAIIFCIAIITICMGLLLYTTIKTPDSKVAQSMTERFEEDNTEKKTESEVKKEEIKKTEEKTAAKKTENTEKKSEMKKEEAKKTEATEKKSDSKKSETQKPETPSKETPKKTEPQKPAEEQSKKEEKKDSTAVIDKKNEPQKNTYNFPAAKNNAQLIFVFDDGGQNLSHLAPFLNLPFPITVAVLPQIAYSKETAAKVRASGNEVILHQPMQSVSASVNPGPGAIKPGMSDEEIKTILFTNINEVGPISGMNNHEGSAITADAEKMAVIMQFCSQEGIYFLDSRTNVETKVPYVAGELGYSYYERNIFLDNEKTTANALSELKKGLDLANKNGSVIMIGHIWSADFLPEFLQDVYPELKALGYTFSTVSKSKAKKN
ncbi:MAG: divergent polysaccharide deacetylase family protein [Spirochaetales bacterium]|nr:divergent polysaccharide deacetylase family protein [Spirochaetales bacterium]